MQLKKLFQDFDTLQKLYGDENLTSVYGAGEIKNPQICFVFMNPTGKNVSSSKSWNGLKAPWLGTKNIWKMFFDLGIIDEELFIQIKEKKTGDWDYNFSNRVYEYLQSQSIYITNLAKCTQQDARHLPNSVFKEYLPLFYREIEILNPQHIITFGGQVSSLILGKEIKISEYRKKSENLEINGKNYDISPIYYPVGQGMRNIKTAKEDIHFILTKNLGQKK